jgi:hypothetical protein
VAVGLAGLAVAGLVATAGVTVRALAVARDTGTAIALATERLESLRTGPRTDGDDVPAAGWTRAWTVTDGRGAPDAVTVDVQGGAAALVLDAEVLP